MSGAGASAPFDADSARGEGPLWGLAAEDLNATLLSWGPGDGVAEHVNCERDVLIVVLAGAGTALVDGAQHALRPHGVLLVAKGARRALRAGPEGMRYLSVHRSRPPLGIEPLIGPEQR